MNQQIDVLAGDVPPDGTAIIDPSIGAIELLGIIEGMSNEAYHAAPGISKSGLDEVAQTPAHYYAEYLDPNRKPREETPAMRAGSALHCAILEPNEFAARYIVEPLNAPRRPTDAQRNAAKPSDNTLHSIAFWDDFNARAAGREILTLDDYDRFMRASDAVRLHPAIAFLFESGDAEQSIFARDPETGVLVKCRPDFRSRVVNAWLDIKSTEDARPGNFARSSFNFGYHRAAAFYPDVAEWAGLERPEVMFFVAFEKSAPFGVKVYEPTPAFIEKGRAEYRAALNLYAECLRRDEWPGYDLGVEALDLPRWAA